LTLSFHGASKDSSNGVSARTAFFLHMDGLFLSSALGGFYLDQVTTLLRFALYQDIKLFR